MNNIVESPFPSIGNFCVRCIARVVSIAVEDCLFLVRKRVKNIRSVISSLSCSAKRWNLFSKLKMELNSPKPITSLGIDIRWSSTFVMIRRAVNCLRVINAMTVRLKDLDIEAVSEWKWSTCYVVFNSLQSAAEITEVESECSYVTLRMVTRSYTFLICVCRDASLQNFKTLHDISQRMISKLKRDKICLCSLVTNLARVFDPTFSKNILRDNDILKKHCTVHDDASIDVTETTDESNRNSIVDKFIENESR